VRGNPHGYESDGESEVVTPAWIEAEERKGWADPKQKPKYSLDENPGASVHKLVYL